jgi:hypothetical protein
VAGFQNVKVAGATANRIARNWRAQMIDAEAFYPCLRQKVANG